MEWSGCLNQLRGYLESSPLIVLGSGASMPYGLPSMSGLAERIKQSNIVKTDSHYDSFCTEIDNLGLEGAIDNVPLSHDTLKEIRNVVWTSVNDCDFAFFDKHSIEPPKALADLIAKVIAPTPNKAVIVTTNYDRLAEYAADSVGATIVNGFEGTLIKRLSLPTSSLKIKRTRSRERTVDIWKVHGSLDWFVASNETVVSFPLARTIPNNFQPLIVTPGNEKYSSTHGEPYRTIIAEADNAFQNAGAYLCIGYGFNDEHIQPKLLEQISNGKPIVILARNITSACRKHIIEAKINKYLIFEYADATHTKVYSNGWEEIYEGQYWLLENFMKIW